MIENLRSNVTAALVRVFVPTYRRNDLLPRALKSLLAQTFTRWVCEVHNDDPTNSFPTQLVKRLGDPRIGLCNHERNLGPAETFNLFFRPTREPFYCVLEDDNWWEPEFLETMTRVMRSSSKCHLGLVQSENMGRVARRFLAGYRPACQCRKKWPGHVSWNLAIHGRSWEHCMQMAPRFCARARMRHGLHRKAFLLVQWKHFESA